MIRFGLWDLGSQTRWNWSTTFQFNSSKAIYLNKSYWQFLRFITNRLFNALEPSKVKGGQGFGSGSSSFFLSFLALSAATLTLLAGFEGTAVEPLPLDSLNDIFCFMMLWLLFYFLSSAAFLATFEIAVDLTVTLGTVSLINAATFLNTGEEKSFKF